ncbi:MAG: hypothetical protein M1499_05420 [Firmicutes bacterium]|jgi:hypothetical protein|nr:hypothetical protein [Bacillota bacterium]
MPEDFYLRAIAQAFPNVAGDPILTEQDLRAIPLEGPWDTAESWGMRIQPGTDPHALVIRGQNAPVLHVAFYRTLIEGIRELAQHAPYWNNHLRAYSWVDENDLILQYPTNIDLSRYRSWKPAAPFYPPTCALTGELVVVGTDANRWLSQGLALYQDDYQRSPETVSDLLSAAMEAKYFLEVDEPPPPVPVIGMIIAGRQAVIT